MGFDDAYAEARSLGRPRKAADGDDRHLDKVELGRSGQRLELEYLRRGRNDRKVQRRRRDHRRRPGMSIHGAACQGGMRSDPEKAGDALRPARVDANHVHGAAVDQPPIALRRPLALARGDAGGDGPAQQAMALDVFGVQRLLDPVEIEGLEQPRHADRLGRRPAHTVARVHHQPRARPHGLARRLHIGNIAAGIDAETGEPALAHAHFHAAEAVGHVACDLLRIGLGRPLGDVDAGNGRKGLVDTAAQQHVQGHAERLALQVP